jgi:hypothetical protein
VRERKGGGRGGARRSEEERGGARRSEEEQGGAGRSREEQGGAGRSREEQGGAKRSKEEQGGAKRSREERGAQRPMLLPTRSLPSSPLRTLPALRCAPYQLPVAQPTSSPLRTSQRPMLLGTVYGANHDGPLRSSFLAPRSSFLVARPTR